MASRMFALLVSQASGFIADEGRARDQSRKNQKAESIEDQDWLAPDHLRSGLLGELVQVFEGDVVEDEAAEKWSFS